jgi:hypothetical protein
MSFFVDQNEAEKKYGAIVNGKWADERKWMMVYTPPSDIQKSLLNSITQTPVKVIYCNKDFSSILAKAFQNVIDAKLLSELKTYDGCFQIRSVRGYPGKMSTHSYGLAIDLNAQLNPLGGKSQWSNDFVKCFTAAGFTWGGDFKRLDAQHFSYAWE